LGRAGKKKRKRKMAGLDCKGERRGKERESEWASWTGPKRRREREIK
jgi:hypothetical protein